ncbi:MAG: Tetracycline resistance protein, class C [Planctomycetes bacterium]|nr:Tetracycline resistance protein, class C [Planctomycetota bacterium]
MRKSPLAVLFLVVFIDLVGFGIVLPLLPRYAERYGVSGFEQGALLASFSAMQFLFAPLWGRLSDRIGRRPVLMTGLLGSILAYTWFAFADGYSALLLSRIAAGIFGATIGTAQAYIADVTDDKDRGRGMALIGAAFGIGFTVGPAIGGIAAGSGHDRLPGFIAAGLSLAAFVTAAFALPEPPRHASRREGGLFGFGGLRHVLSTPTLPWVIGLQVFATFVFAMFESTLSLWTRAAFGFAERENGWLFTWVGFCLVVAQGAVVRRLMPKVGELRFVVTGTALLASGLVGMAWARSLPLLLGVLCVIVFGFAMLTPSLSSLLSRRSPPSIQGEVLGINQSGLSLARIFGPLAGNVLLVRGLELPALFGAALMILCLLAAMRLSRLPAPSPVGS